MTGSREVVEAASPPDRIARAILSCLHVSEIRERLDRHVCVEGERGYTILFQDSRSGELSIYLAGPDTRAMHLGSEHLRSLAEIFETGDGKLRPIELRVPGALPVRAVATLAFGDEKYGLLLLHSEAEVATASWNLFVEVLAAELIKAQLYEAASYDSSTSRSKLAALNEAGELLKYVDLDMLLAKLMGVSVGIMHAQVGAIVLAKGDGFETGVEWGLSEKICLSLRTTTGESFLQAALERGDPILIEDVACSEELDAGSLEVNLQSLLAIPLLTQSRRLGLIVIVNGGADGLDRESFEVLSTIANLSASAVESAILYREAIEHERISAEMDLASSVQSALLPTEAPVREGVELMGWNVTCTETGGDYFDFLDLGQGRTAVVVGDATGHGMGAALMMIVTRATLRALLTQTDDLVDVFETMNDLIEASSETNRFMTLFLGVVDREARKLVYVSAGHDSPIVSRRERDEVVEYGSTGIPLGVLGGSRYSTREVDLREGDFWIFGTDGIWEARNRSGEFYGKERLREIVKQTRELGLAEASEKIRRDVLDFHDGAEQLDDITAVLMKVSGARRASS